VVGSLNSSFVSESELTCAQAHLRVTRAGGEERKVPAGWSLVTRRQQNEPASCWSPYKLLNIIHTMPTSQQRRKGHRVNLYEPFSLSLKLFDMVPSLSADNVATRVFGVDVFVEDNREGKAAWVLHAVSQDWLFLHPPEISGASSNLRITWEGLPWR